jgi:hypothetical protein
MAHNPKVAGYSQQTAHPSGRLAKASTFKLTLVKALPRNQTNRGVESFWFGPFFFRYQTMTTKVAGYSTWFYSYYAGLEIIFILL